MMRTVSQFLCMHTLPGKLVVDIATLTLMLKSYELVKKKTNRCNASVNEVKDEQREKKVTTTTNH